MEIDKNKLADVIKDNINLMFNDDYEEDRFCVGEVKGIQVHIVLTDDENEKFKAFNLSEICITES